VGSLKKRYNALHREVARYRTRCDEELADGESLSEIDSEETSLAGQHFYNKYVSTQFTTRLCFTDHDGIIVQ
jgi:hypothetical protein